MAGVSKIISQIQLAREWAPAWTLLSAVRSATDPSIKARAIVELLRFIARRTDTKLDDDVVAWLSVALLLPEAAVLFRWFDLVSATVALEPPPEMRS